MIYLRWMFYCSCKLDYSCLLGYQVLNQNSWSSHLIERSLFNRTKNRQLTFSPLVHSVLNVKIIWNQVKYISGINNRSREDNFSISNGPMKTPERWKIDTSPKIDRRWKIDSKDFYVRFNGSQLKNPDISGALYLLRIQY